jgi:hypothetical protein
MTKRAIPYVLAALLLVAGFASLHQYNATWDEAIGDLFFGQRYLSFFTSFDFRYLDFRADPYPPSFRPDLSSSPFRLRPWEHYPVASTLATATSRLFSPFLDPFDGYHAFNLLIGALFLVVFYRFVGKEHGDLAAMCAVAFLFLSPRIAGDLMANVKDFSEMVFFSITAILFFYAVERGSVRGLLLAGCVWGLALGTKANALFLPWIVILYLLARGIPPAWADRRRALLLAIIGFGVVGAVVFFVSWPYLWQDPIRTLRSNAMYLLARKSGTAPQNTSGPFAMIFLTTPIVLLCVSVFSTAFLFRKVRERSPWEIFLACWIAVVVARLALPAAVNFDGVRHFLELFPPIAAVAGATIGWAMSRYEFRTKLLIGSVFVIAMLIPLIRVHPFETTYWNRFAGGLSGALKRKNPQAGDYWAASYRIGLRWLNENAPPNSILVVPIAEHTVRIVAPYRLRPDIQLAHITNAWSPRVLQPAWAEVKAASGDRPVFVMFILRRDWANEVVQESFTSFQPAASWSRDGAPVLLIFRVTRKT